MNVRCYSATEERHRQISCHARLRSRMRSARSTFGKRPASPSTGTTCPSKGLAMAELTIRQGTPNRERCRGVHSVLAFRSRPDGRGAAVYRVG